MHSPRRRARHCGFANILIFHKLTDLENIGDEGSAMLALASSNLANAETRVIYPSELELFDAISRMTS